MPRMPSYACATVNDYMEGQRFEKNEVVSTSDSQPGSTASVQEAIPSQAHVTLALAGSPGGSTLA